MLDGGIPLHVCTYQLPYDSLADTCTFARGWSGFGAVAEKLVVLYARGTDKPSSNAHFIIPTRSPCSYAWPEQVRIVSPHHVDCTNRSHLVLLLTGYRVVDGAGSRRRLLNGAWTPSNITDVTSSSTFFQRRLITATARRTCLDSRAWTPLNPNTRHHARPHACTAPLVS